MINFTINRGLTFKEGEPPTSNGLVRVTVQNEGGHPALALSDQISLRRARKMRRELDAVIKEIEKDQKGE